MKKVITKTAVALSLTLGIGALLPVTNLIPNAYASDYIVLGSYTLSKEQVKSMAATMRATTGGTATIIETLVGFLGPGATVTMAATALSANAQSQTEVLYAADNNMRVSVVVKDLPVHTSYSTIVEFKAIK